jgi:gliding motility-associated-like protein
MKVPRSVLSLVIIVFLSFECSGQWQQTNGPAAGTFFEMYRIDQYLFANGEVGGIFRSADNGLHWEAIKNGLPAYPHSYVLAVDGTDMYAGIAGQGVYVSKDLGDHWSLLSPFLANITASGVAAAGQDIYVGDANGGLYYSPDAGAHWNFYSGPFPAQQIHHFLRVGSELWIFANAFYTSANNGKTWVKSNVPTGSNAPSAFWKDGNDIYLGGYDVNNWPTLFVSHDNAATWTQSPEFFWSTIMAITSTGTELFLADGSSIRYSTNNGSTWTEKPYPINFGFVINLFLDNGALFASTTQGVYVSFDKGDTWAKRSTGLTNLVVEYVAMDNNEIIASSTFQGPFFSSDGGQTWEARTQGLDDIRAMDVTGIYVYNHSIYIGTGLGVYRSDNHGANWTLVLPLDINENVQSIAGDGATIIANSYKGCYVSKNAGLTWTLKGAGVIGNNDLQFGLVSGSNIITGTYGIIFISVDGGNSWRTSSIPGDQAYITDAVFHHGKLFIATWLGLYYSRDLGLSWTKLDALAAPVVDLYTDNNVLIAGTGNGLFLSYKDGNSWHAANTNLNNQNVYSFVTDGNYCYVGTYGASVWKIKFTDLPLCTALSAAVTLENHCGEIEITNYDNGTITWNKDGKPTGLSGVTVYATSAGTYSVTVTNDCSSAQSNNIVLTENNRAPDKPIIKVDCDVLVCKPSPPDSKIAWYKNDEQINDQHSQSLHLTDSAYYKVEVINECGSATSTAVYAGGKPSVDIYNVFTPNNDTFNDVYKLDPLMTGAQFQVFNQWGKEVYASDSYQNDWDASSLNSGVYFYVIRKSCYGEYKGTLSIVKGE